MSSPLSISTADLAGVETMVGWAAAEGWNPGLHDAAAFHATDPGGFLLGSIDGQPVAGISVVRYGPEFAFLGLYIVRPEWRGRGHGLAMWRAAIELAGPRVVGLDGVVAHQADYARSGFVLTRRNIRYGGTKVDVQPPALGIPAVPLDPVTDANRALVDSYDGGVFPARRRRFLEAWLMAPGHVALAALDDGGIRGYGVLRPCRAGYKVGPLFADDEATAGSIFTGLAASAGGSEVFLDVPETNLAARRLVERHGLAPVFETARMYAGVPPQEPVDRIYGVTTFELG